MMHNIQCNTQQNPEKLRFFRRQLSQFQCIHTIVWHHRHAITDILWTQLFNCLFFCNFTGASITNYDRGIVAKKKLCLHFHFVLFHFTVAMVHCFLSSSGKDFCGLVEFNQINYHILFASSESININTDI